ncbi:unnamed protein product [Cuscuta epithymum]|uniref:Uncharacterized protein n=1 Tax=Cuscuta epithymum TaxID=186058 RepID=A0AAV0GF22_9ASTE|nr:unnamed protein product [Cuscuta epithymum]CAH9146571.1 unnamed protein product [Cuscuta epithymum]
MIYVYVVYKRTIEQSSSVKILRLPSLKDKRNKKNSIVRGSRRFPRPVRRSKVHRRTSCISPAGNLSGQNLYAASSKKGGMACRDNIPRAPDCIDAGREDKPSPEKKTQLYAGGRKEAGVSTARPDCCH